MKYGKLPNGCGDLKIRLDLRERIFLSPLLVSPILFILSSSDLSVSSASVGCFFRLLLCWCRRLLVSPQINHSFRSRRLPRPILFSESTDSEFIPPFNICVLSDSITYFPLGPLSLCIFGEMSFFGVLWNSIGVDFSFRSNIFLSAVRTVCFVPSTAILIFPKTFLPVVSSASSSQKKVYGYWRLQLTGTTGLLSGDLCDVWQVIFCWSYLCDPSILLFHFRPHRSGSAWVILKRSMLSGLTNNFCCLWL